MYVIRPITLDDLQSLEEFAMQTAIGMTSLPKNGPKLKKVIKNSIDSFSREIVQPGSQRYTFILEDTDSGKVIGTCGIYAKTGVIEPLHFYKIETIQPQSRHITLPKELTTIRHISYHDGPTELCGLYLMPQYRKEGMGALLSLSRLLFIASHPHRFSDTVMARLRGFIRKSDHSSPFWDGVGGKFVDLTFKEIQKLLESSHAFIPDILPKHPIYTLLIPKYAQIVLGKTHPTTRPALKMLKRENLKITDEIDIFDGGPTLSSPTNEITTIKNSRVAKVAITRKVFTSKKQMICNTHTNFRACFDELDVRKDGRVSINKSTADALQVKEGESIRFI